MVQLNVFFFITFHTLLRNHSFLGWKEKNPQILIAHSISAFKWLLFASATILGLRKHGLYLLIEWRISLFLLHFRWCRTCPMHYEVSVGSVGWDQPQVWRYHGAGEGQQVALGGGCPQSHQAVWWQRICAGQIDHGAKCISILMARPPRSPWDFCPLFPIPALAYVCSQVAEAQHLNLLLLGQNFH